MVGPIALAPIFLKMFGTAKAGTVVAPIAAKGGIAWGAMATGAGAGLLGGTFLGGLFGGSKKDIAQTAAPQDIVQKQEAPQTTITKTYTSTYAPVTTHTITSAPTYMNIIDSPYAQLTKKDVISAEAAVSPILEIAPQIDVRPTLIPSQAASQAQAMDAAQTDGTNMLALAAVAGIALIGYGYVSKRRKK